jgi:hypothetical protein
MNLKERRNWIRIRIGKLALLFVDRYAWREFLSGGGFQSSMRNEASHVRALSSMRNEASHVRALARA